MVRFGLVFCSDSDEQSPDLILVLLRFVFKKFLLVLSHNSVYMQLLCKFEPHAVLKFLESYENYRLEHCLKLCQEYGITDAAIFLLERVGDVASALDLVLKDVEICRDRLELFVSTSSRTSVQAFDKDQQSVVEVRSYNSNWLAYNVLYVDYCDFSILLELFVKIFRAQCFSMMLNFKRCKFVVPLHYVQVGAVKAAVAAAVALCQRNTQRLEPRESITLWFRLLDRYGLISLHIMLLQA